MIISGKYSLVLGGGGARGLSHIGVLKYLEEEKLFPGEVVGTSMGALIGALFCAGMSSTQIIESLEKVNIYKLLDPNINNGLLKGQKIMKLLEKILGNILFDQLSIPLKIVTTDFFSGKKVVLSTGSLLFAIRASFGVPGIFNLHKVNNKILVDGGLVSNLPINEAKNKKIIASSTAKEINKEQKISYSKKIFYFKSITKNLIRAKSIILKNQEDFEIENSNKNIILIRPNFNESVFAFKKKNILIDKGYKDISIKFQKKY